MKRIVGVTYCDGLCIEVTVDGIIDDNTKPDEPVHFERIVYAHWKKEYKSGVKVKDGYVSSCCDMWNERKTRYCPNCCAKMDEVSE